MERADTEGESSVVEEDWEGVDVPTVEESSVMMEPRSQHDYSLSELLRSSKPPSRYELGNEGHSSSGEEKLHPLLSPAYTSLLGKHLKGDTEGHIFVVIYKYEIPLGKEETFLDSYWKQENLLRRYCLGSYINKVVSVPGLDESPTKANADAIKKVGRGETEAGSCNSCLEEGRENPCAAYVPGPITRFTGHSRKQSMDVLAEGEEKNGGAFDKRSSEKLTPPDKKPSRRVSAVSHTLNAAKNLRNLKFTDRRCRNCSHTALNHTREETVMYCIYTEWKNRTAWRSAYPDPTDVANSEMKNCVARFYEPLEMEMIDEHMPEGEDGLWSSTEDSFFADSAAASRSRSIQTLSNVAAVKANGARFFRLTVWKGRQLPPGEDSKPHNWVVQVKYGRKVLTSVARRSDSPAWKSHFHFKYKKGERLFLRVIPKDKSGTSPDQRRVKLRVPKSPTGLGSADEDPWSSARQWVELERKVSLNGNDNEEPPAGQILVSFQMNVVIRDPLALHKVTVDRGESSEESAKHPLKFALFKTIKPMLETGDVVVMTGKGWVGSTTERYQRKQWTHYGVILVVKEYDMLLVWELNAHSGASLHGKTKVDVQVTDLATKVRDGKYRRVGIRKLNVERTPAMQQAVTDLRSTLENTLYSDFREEVIEKFSQLKKSGEDARIPKSDDLQKMFSIELVNRVFHATGLLPFDAKPFTSVAHGEPALSKGTLEPAVYIERSFVIETKNFEIAR